MRSRLKVRTREGGVGELTVNGVGYTDGVVLYDSLHTDRVQAKPIEAFACAPRPDLDGNWLPRIGGRYEWFPLIMGALVVADCIAGLIATIVARRFIYLLV